MTWTPNDVVHLIGVIGASLTLIAWGGFIAAVRYKRGEEARVRAHRLEQDISNLGYNAAHAERRIKYLEEALAAEQTKHPKPSAITDAKPFDPDRITP